MKNDPLEVRHTKQAITQLQVYVALLQSVHAMIRKIGYDGEVDQEIVDQCSDNGMEKVHAIMSAMPQDEVVDQYACMLQAHIAKEMAKTLLILTVSGDLQNGLQKLNDKCENEIVTLERKLVELQTA